MILECKGLQVEVTEEVLRKCRVFERMFDDLGLQGDEGVYEIETAKEVFKTFCLWIKNESFFLNALCDKTLLMLTKLSNELEATELLEICRQEFSDRLEQGTFVVLPFARPWSSAKQARQAIQHLPSWIDKTDLYDSIEDL